MDSIQVLKCVQALDLPYFEGIKVLEQAGWRYSDRFELTASDFVKNLINKTLEVK